MSSYSIVGACTRPTTDEEFHQWIKLFFGWSYPNKAVCLDRGHVSPFEFFARAFFEDFTAGANVGPRGGGKTLGFSVLHMANSIFKRPCWTCHVGAVERQAERCRDYIDQYRRKWPWSEMITQHGSTMRLFWNQSRIEILPGTMNQVSGPRPQKATFDEVEFWPWEIYQQAINMITGTPEIPGQLLLTSTRQKLFGTMNRIVEMSQRTKMKSYVWCVYETMQRCPIGADPTLKGRTCALFESKDPETGLGRCQMRDEHGDVVFRCQHDAGHMSYADVIRDFSNADEETWDTQKECRRPTRRGLIYTNWNADHHVSVELATYNPYVPIILGFDWGWSVPSVVGFYQLRGEVLYRFDEIWGLNMDVDVIIEKVKSKLAGYPNAKLGWAAADKARPDYCQKIHQAFKIPVNQYDKRKGFELETTHYGPIEQGIAECRRLLRDARGMTWYYVHPKCTFHIKEFDLYHYEEESRSSDGTIHFSDKPADEDDHCVHGDTWIDTATGPQQIRNLVGKNNVYVWAFQEDGKKVVLRRASDIRLTRKNVPVVCVFFDRGQPLVCTPDHLFMMTKGYWARADQLKSGDRIRHLNFKRAGDDRLLVKTGRSRSLYEPAERIALESLFGEVHPDSIVVPIDGDWQNVHPDNLEVLMPEQYCERFKEEMAAYAVQVRSSHNKARIKAPPDVAVCVVCLKPYERVYRARTCSQTCEQRLKTAAYNLRRFVSNHVVLRVESAGTADVYNMHVEGAENFIANGVCVHNSMDEWRYVAMQLKRRRRPGSLDIAFSLPEVRVRPTEGAPATILVEPRTGVKGKIF